MDELLNELKDVLKITWNEEDASLIKLLEKGKAYLSGLTNASFDFSKELIPKDLLLERCRYVYNNAGDEFEKIIKGIIQAYFRCGFRKSWCNQWF